MSITHAQIRLWTRQEYERLAAQGLFAPGERVELIEGEIVAMTPQASQHATSVGLTQDVLVRVFPEGFIIRVQLPLALGLRSMPEPDLTVVVGTRRDYRNSHPSTAVLVVEVADATLQFDRVEKASLYAAAGIRDYWVLNLVDRVLEVYREPGPLAGAPFSHAYHASLRLAPSDRVAPLAAPTANIILADLLP